MDFGIASVAGITALCYLAAMAVKATSVDNKWLPVICGVIGAALGVVGITKLFGSGVAVSASPAMFKRQ